VSHDYNIPKSQDGRNASPLPWFRGWPSEERRDAILLELLTRPLSIREMILTGALTIAVPTVVILVMSLFPAGSKFLREVLGARVD
jgi:hypothetical protein